MFETRKVDSPVGYGYFEARAGGPQHALLAWRDSVGHVIDVHPSLAQLQVPFNASISRYRIKDRLFTDCSSDALWLERCMARIAIDKHRDYVFHVFVDGGLQQLRVHGVSRDLAPSGASLVLLDLAQPVRMLRNSCRVLTLFVPRPIVEATLPNAEALHGRVFDEPTALTHLLIEQTRALAFGLRGMSEDQAARAFDGCVQLLLGAFGRQARLLGDARAAVRAAMFDKARRHVKSHLHRPDLSAESVLQALQLPRPSLYRLFEHEGGLATYIRNRRLRAASEELVRMTHVPVTEIAYGLGFGSASNFARAFRRAYGMTPQELRLQAFQRLEADLVQRR